MNVTFSTNKLFQLMFILSALVLLAQSYELTFAVWFLVATVTIRYSYSVKILQFFSVLFLVLVIAFFASFFYEYKVYNYFRDIAYLLKPIIGLLLGYNLCRLMGSKTLPTIVYTGVLLATIHVFVLGFYFFFVGIKDLNALREYGGYFNDFEIYVLILLVFRDKFNIALSKKMTMYGITILAISSFLYFARTNIIQFFILFVAMKGYLRVTKKSITILSAVIFCVLSSYAAIYYSNPKRQGKGIEAFLYKIKIAPIEAFKTKINENDWKEFNDNYRSFENIITVKNVTYEGNHAIAFGKGLGSTIDIGREMWTNDGEFIRYIPTLHNAYMTIFLKSGLLGVLLMLIFIYLLFNNRRTDFVEVKHINFLLVGSAFYLILSNWVFMGLYLKLDNKSIFLGALLCYKEYIQKQHRLGLDR